MQMKNELKSILRTRHFLVIEDSNADGQFSAYLNAYLLSNFGIIVDKPACLTKAMVQQIAEEFHLTVPKSFYSNPQDTNYFSCGELLLEQFVSYFAYGSDLGRIEMFKKDLPEYVVGDELKLRTFYIVTFDEAVNVLREIMDTYCAYSRPFSVDEMNEFLTLYNAGFDVETDMKCKDNIFALLPVDESFARFLDKKDIVKLSIQKFGDKATFNNKKAIQADLNELARYMSYVKNCPMSKKQAKYFNKLVSLCGLNMPKATNAQSPDRKANKFLAEGNVVGAAEVFAANGAMLERRIKMLLSRANPMEAIEILNMIPAENPIVLYQLMSNLAKDDSEARTFTFFRNNKVKVHRETEYEAKYRKSRLNESTCKFLAEACIERIKEYYRALPTLGKVYVAPNFYKLGMPTNTSASGKGIDVLPIGSRLPITCSNVRTFVHWKHAFDIDSSLIVVDKDGNITTQGWFNYGCKNFGSDILFSGDITGANGAEYFDIKLDQLAKQGYRYVVQTFHGYCSKLDSGEIYAGYQNKANLNTRAWDPKNIETQFRVYGDSRGCVAFAIDIQNREMIILNQIVECDDRVVRPEGFKTIEKYLQPNYLDINVGLIAECRGELVTDPAEADVVFDDTFVPAIENEDGEVNTPVAVIRSYELEKLVAFINK